MTVLLQLPALIANGSASAFAVPPTLRQLHKMPMAALRHAPDIPNDEIALWVETRIWLMLGIFVVSLFGVWPF